MVNISNHTYCNHLKVYTTSWYHFYYGNRWLPITIPHLKARSTTWWSPGRGGSTTSATVSTAQRVAQGWIPCMVTRYHGWSMVSWWSTMVAWLDTMIYRGVNWIYGSTIVNEGHNWVPGVSPTRPPWDSPSECGNRSDLELRVHPRHQLNQSRTRTQPWRCHNEPIGQWWWMFMVKWW